MDSAPVAKKGGKTGLIIGLLLGVIAIVTIVIVVFAVIIPNASKGGDEKKDNGNSKEEKKEEKKDEDVDPIVGIYDVYSTISDGEESKEAVTMMKAFGVSITIEFKKDGTGEMITKADPSAFNINTGEEDEDEDEEEEEEPVEAQEEVVTFTYGDGKIDMKNEESGETQSGTYELSEDKKYVTVTVDGEGVKFKRQ
jgi:ribosomal protein L12E/L44/L45/RPP1/RPP2